LCVAARPSRFGLRRRPVPAHYGAVTRPQANKSRQGKQRQHGQQQRSQPGDRQRVSTTAGHLNFSDELPALKSELWDYVIVHEMLHFSVPNHGKLWKSLMRSHLGEYEAHEGELKRIAGNQAPQRTR
jgi:hypothetical protein